MDITPQIIAAIPRGKLAIPVTDFAALWRHAEALGQHPTNPDAADHYLAGVINTCRWLYAGPVPNYRKQWVIPETPFTHWHIAADPETIDAEYLRALQVWPKSHPNRLDLACGVANTLGWACQGTGRAPLDMTVADAVTG